VRSVAGVFVVSVLLLPQAPVPAQAAKPRPTCQGVPATIVGTTHNTDGTDGDDVIVVRGEGLNYIRAGGGNDLICGGVGHDFLYDGTGRDRFYGGDGQDFLKQESVERDFFDGGPGFDEVDYYLRTEDLYVNLRNTKADDGVPGEHDTLVSVGAIDGGQGDDVLIAGNVPNLDGHGFPAFSAYYLRGGPGDDVLIGGPLGDLVSAGPGNDVLKGRGGRDFLDADDDDGTFPYQHFADHVDGGKDEARDVAVCDELDIVRNVSSTRGC